MATREIQVGLCIKQVVDGSCYEGYVEIAGTKFGYELVLGIPVTRIGRLAEGGNVAEVRRSVQISLKRDDVNVELTDEEYGLFFVMIVASAVAFYVDPRIRALNETLNRLNLCAEGPDDPSGISVKLTLTNHEQSELSQQFYEMLSQPKFGCVFHD